MHALIIEDEMLIAMDVERVLRECGFSSVAIAISEEEAITAAADQCPDLITCDVRLNPGSGIEAIASICRQRSIPVIFLTGSPDEARRRYPSHAVLTKPFTEAGVRREVSLAMAGTR